MFDIRSNDQPSQRANRSLIEIKILHSNKIQRIYFFYIFKKTAAEIYGRNELQAPTSPDGLFTEGVRVFSNYLDAFPENLVDIEHLGSYHRPYRVWMRHTSTDLYELTLRPVPLAESNETEVEPEQDAILKNIEAVTFDETTQIAIDSDLAI